MLVDTPEKMNVAEKQARGDSCAARCIALYGPTPGAAVCLYKCTLGRSFQGKIDCKTLYPEALELQNNLFALRAAISTTQKAPTDAFTSSSFPALPINEG
jgi:hypothetical protein